MVDKERNESEIAPAKVQRGHDWNKMCDFFCKQKRKLSSSTFPSSENKGRTRTNYCIFGTKKAPTKAPFACLLPVKDDIYALQLDSSSTQVEVFVFLFCR